MQEDLAAPTDTDRQARLLRLSQYSPDVSDAPVPYSQRLAETEGWSRLYTLTVIEEYERFAYLAVFAGHPVTPSESIDTTWYPHLQYSKEYWTVFCGEVLRAPLYRASGIGAPDGGDVHAQHYTQALESYRCTFDEEPPVDVWPRPEQPEAVQVSETIVPTWHAPDPVVPPPVSTTRSFMSSV